MLRELGYLAVPHVPGGAERGPDDEDGGVLGTVEPVLEQPARFGGLGGPSRGGSGPRLPRSRLRGTRLRGTRLRGTRLRGTRLRGTRLRGTRLRRLRTRSRVLSGVRRLRNGTGLGNRAGLRPLRARLRVLSGVRRLPHGTGLGHRAGVGRRPGVAGLRLLRSRLRVGGVRRLRARSRVAGVRHLVGGTGLRGAAGVLGVSRSGSRLRKRGVRLRRRAAGDVVGGLRVRLSRYGPGSLGKVPDHLAQQGLGMGRPRRPGGLRGRLAHVAHSLQGNERPSRSPVRGSPPTPRRRPEPPDRSC
ncbi:pentapeptide repeat-containing protein [Streptomyces sp. NPDC006289]|uniref:pentapeptide repeat-containing protein n=1 Tax=Streptomyces sp. NPDC006289 TaxID=3156744 RepID=UPI0033B9C353